MDFTRPEKSDRDAGGKTLQAKFPPQAGLPSPCLPPSRTRILQRKKVYNPISEGLRKVDRGTHPHPRKRQAVAERRASSSWYPGPGWPGASGRPGTRPGLPAARLPTGRNSFSSAAGAFGPGCYLGHVPAGWTKDATGTPGRGGDPAARADNGLVERWGRGWPETRRTEGWGRACREAPVVAALRHPTRWG